MMSWSELSFMQNTKYLVRGLYAIKYPDLEIPFKIPMPRPVDAIFKNWAGPSGGAISKRYPNGRTYRESEVAAMGCAEQFIKLIEMPE